MLRKIIIGLIIVGTAYLLTANIFGRILLFERGLDFVFRTEYAKSILKSDTVVAHFI